MKRTLGILARIVLGLVGAAYILYSINWVDHVVLPAGYEIAGTPLTHMTTADVEIGPDGSLTVLPGTGVDERFTLPPIEEAIEPGGALDPSLPVFKPSVFTLFRRSNPALLALGFVLVGMIYPLQSWRWLILMRCRGLMATYLKSFRLTMVGQFFSFCMPGMTGGDVMRAYYVAKGSDRRAVAVMSVIFDRACGLLGLVILGGLAGLLMLDNPLVRQMTLLVWIALASLGVVSFAYFSRRIREKLPLEAMMNRLPGGGFVRTVDEAATAYWQHKPTVAAATLVSVPTHLVYITGTAMAGYALGMRVELVLLLTVLPVVLLAASVPLTFQGAGVMEFLAVTLLAAPIDAGLATTTQVVSMLLIMRLYQVIYGLLGSVTLLRGDIHLHPQEADGGADAP